jgi:hypothetical protein
VGGDVKAQLIARPHSQQAKIEARPEQQAVCLAPWRPRVEFQDPLAELHASPEPVVTVATIRASATP